MNLGLSEQLLTISQLYRLVIILIVLELGLLRALSVTSIVVHGLEKTEINSSLASGEAIFLARDKDLVNLLSLFSLFNHLPQYFFQHSIFRRLLADAILRVHLARIQVDGGSVHPRSRVAHFR